MSMTTHLEEVPVHGASSVKNLGHEGVTIPGERKRRRRRKRRKAHITTW
jgi:hypothetical protein